MKTLEPDLGRIRTDFPQKCTWTGARVGSAEPLVRPAPPCRLSPPPSSGSLPGGSWCQVVGAGAWMVSLVYHVGPFCLCYARRDLLRLLLRTLHVFMLFLTCVPAINNSPTLVEFVSNNSYHYCWCSLFECLCRS